MAVDAWLLDQLIARQKVPTLRFYRWQPIAISLGHHQKKWPDEWRSLTWQGQPIDVVRRPSGGRAVIHQGDLTYAITMPIQGNRQDSYRQICDALIAAWKRLGVSLDYGIAGRGYRDQASCFSLATAADLVAPNRYKLMGSAQLRRDHYLLQHGSIRLWPDLDFYAQVFGADSQNTAKPPEVIPEAPDDTWIKQLSMMMAEELGRSLNVSFDALSISEQEWGQIEEWRSQFLIPQCS